MGFTTAVRSVFRQYARFAGRARRSEYWWWALFQTLAILAAGALDSITSGDPSDITEGTGPMATLTTLALVLPSLAVTVRRLHDTDKSAWWILWALVPVLGFILLFVWCLLDTTPGDNRFGAPPKITGWPGPDGRPGPWHGPPPVQQG